MLLRDPEESVGEPEPFESKVMVDEALKYLASSIFCTLHYLDGNSDIYRTEE